MRPLLLQLCSDFVPPVFSGTEPDLCSPRQQRKARFGLRCLHGGEIFTIIPVQLLTGLETQYLALCFPGENSYSRLYAYTDAAGQALLYQNRNRSMPFLLEGGARSLLAGSVVLSVCPAVCVSTVVPAADRLSGWRRPRRCGTGKGTGRRCFTGTGEHDILLCAVTAQGQLRSRQRRRSISQAADSRAVGVQLTISRQMQRAAEAVAAETMTSGCILVLDTASAAVRASVSMPGYDPDNLAASLDAPDSPFLNRAVANAMRSARCSSRCWQRRHWNSGASSGI